MELWRIQEQNLLWGLVLPVVLWYLDFRKEGFGLRECCAAL